MSRSPFLPTSCSEEVLVWQQNLEELQKARPTFFFFLFFSFLLFFSSFLSLFFNPLNTHLSAKNGECGYLGAFLDPACSFCGGLFRVAARRDSERVQSLLHFGSRRIPAGLMRALLDAFRRESSLAPLPVVRPLVLLSMRTGTH